MHKNDIHLVMSDCCCGNKFFIYFYLFIYLFIYFINKLVSFILKYFFYETWCCHAFRWETSCFQSPKTDRHIPVLLIHFSFCCQILSSSVSHLTFHLRKTAFHGLTRFFPPSDVMLFDVKHVDLFFPTNCFHCQTYYFAQLEIMRSTVRPLAFVICHIVAFCHKLC